LAQLGQAILSTGAASSVILGELSADLSAILAGGAVRVCTPYLAM
jgi:hypothetical protein